MARQATPPGLAVVKLFNPSPAFIAGEPYAFVRSKEGALFVASSCLSMFDGASWQQIPVPGAKRVLALAAGTAPERIWVGADGAIGYLERDARNQWLFVSLLPQLKQEGVPDLLEIHHVHPTADGAIFVSRSRVLHWDGSRFRSWDLPAPARLYAFSSDGDLFIYRQGTGLLRMEETGPNLFLSQNLLPVHDNPLIGYFTLGIGNEFAVFQRGVWRRTENEWIRLDDVSNILADARATHATRIDRTTAAIATFSSGVILLAEDGALLRIVDGNSGLLSDTASSIWADTEENLWIGLATGIACLRNTLTESLFDHRTGLGDGIQKAFLHENRPVFLTTRSLYTLQDGRPSVVPPLQKIEWTLPEVWDGTSIGNEIWVAATGGLWRISNENTLLVYETPNQVPLLTKAQALPQGLVFFDNATCRLMQPLASGASTRELYRELDSIPVSVVEEDDGSALWVSTETGNVSRLLWSKEDGRPNLRLGRRYSLGPATSSSKQSRLTSLSGTIVAFAGDNILTYSDASEQFAPLAGFEYFRGVAAASLEHSDHGFWLVQNRGLGTNGPAAVIRVQHKPDGKGMDWAPIDIPGLDHIGSSTNLSLTNDNGGETLWIAGAYGMLRHEFGKSRIGSQQTPSLGLHKIRITANREPVSALEHGARFSPGVNELRFIFPAAGAVRGETIFYETKLEGVETEWSQPKNLPEREFTGLSAGSYVFMARAIDRFGRRGPIVRYSFVLEAPWYRTAPTMVGLVLGAALVLYAGVRWRLRQLQRQAERLNRLVGERTQELLLSNTAKSEFLENISHEIRNPLNGIVGMIDLVTQQNPEWNSNEHLRSLKECSASLVRVFNDVLNFSKLEYGYVTVDQHPFSLTTLIESVRATFLDQVTRQGGKLSVRIPASFPDSFNGDEAKIRTVLNNFVGNAVKYAPGTAIEITVSGTESGEDKLNLLIEVADGGPGVPPEEQEVIFQKFVRGSRARATKVTGSGIGLATCRILANLMGGGVGIESEQGKGAIFFLKLPVGIAQKPAPTLPAAVLPEPGQRRALIIEDQHFNQVALAAVVRRLGYEVECVFNASEAAAVLAQHAFELIFLDLKLPGTKGTEIARFIRSSPSGREVVLIGVSASDSREAAQRCLASGMDAFLLKPVSDDLVSATVHAVLARRSSGTEPGAALNFSTLELVARSAPGGMAEAVRLYLTALDGEIDALEQAVRTGKKEDIAAQAHRICSHAAVVSAEEMGRTAKELETAAGAGQIEQSAKALEKIRKLAADLSQRLKERNQAVDPESG